ncbi:hypothetical protein HZY97_16275 [Sphingomonas sp. R-74633]|uniref:hypothetical protein n=1 Tax=Sphingomonas sp. R-74633 TaxID=2751188 RepID=UPI0015D2923D|nr:hypothetical protein [Sphingomonas sp. R-74633]NYT42330.1 hypothetical protein [Sphingomonas sp. R-74633]
MTIATTARTVMYAGNGATVTFAVPYQFRDTADLRVTAIAADGAETVKTLSTHYMVTGGGSPPAPGSVTMLAAPALGTQLLIEGARTIRQAREWAAGDRFPAAATEGSADDDTIVAQELRRDLEDLRRHALTTPRGEDAPSLPSLAGHDGELMWLKDGVLQPLAKSPFAGMFYGGGADGAPVPLSGTGADVALRGDLAGNSGMALVGNRLSLTGANKRVLAELDRRIVSVEHFYPQGVNLAALTPAQLVGAITLAIASAIAEGHDIYFPAGLYNLGSNYFPLRQTANPNDLTDFLDANNLTIYGSGPRSTVFKTVSSIGWDVFQLNGVKNAHFRDFMITAELTATDASGSNGMSFTGGLDNITVKNVHFLNLPSIDRSDAESGPFIDGGKALTVQCDGAPLEVGFLQADICVWGCAQAFAIEAGLTNFLDKRTMMEIDVYAEDCFSAVSISAAEADGPVPADTHFGIRVRSQSVNCQKDVQLGRAHGVDVRSMVRSIKSVAELRKSPDDINWYEEDLVVEALHCAYAKNSTVVVIGEKQHCDYKAQIGGTGAGASGLLGATEWCEITLSIGGTAALQDIRDLDVGGNLMNYSTLSVTAATGVIPPAFYLASRFNILFSGDGRVRMPLQGYEASSADVPKVADFAWRNQGSVTAADTATSLVLTGDADGELHCLVEAAPAPPFSRYLRGDIVMQATSAANVNLSAEILLLARNSVNSRLVTFRLIRERLAGTEVGQADFRANVSNWTSETAADSFAVTDRHDVVPFKWARMDVTAGGNMEFYVSHDGRSWVGLGTVAISAFLTATGGGALNQVGFGIRSITGTPCTAFIQNFSGNAPS